MIYLYNMFKTLFLIIICVNIVVTLPANDAKLLITFPWEGIYLKPNLYDTNTYLNEYIKLDSGQSIRFYAIDYNYNRNAIIWLGSHVSNGRSLYGAPIDPTKPSMFNKTHKLLNLTHKSERLAIDWIHDLIYISAPKGIEVISIGHKDQYYSYDVIQHNQTYGDVSVDPIHGLLFWLQWDYNTVTTKDSGSIMRANQDGSDPIVLSTVTEVPNTIALDIAAQVVYWVELTHGILYSVNYNGAYFKTMVEITNFGYIYSMDIFENNIYWIHTHYNNQVYIFNRTDANITKRLWLQYPRTMIMSFKVLDSRRQMHTTNRCANSNCAHMCLPVQRDYRCVCSKNANQFTANCTDEPILHVNSIDICLLSLPKVISHDTTPITWIVSDNCQQFVTVFVSIGVNLVLIAIFIYWEIIFSRFRNFWVKFRDDRHIDITLSTIQTIVNNEL